MTKLNNPQDDNKLLEIELAQSIETFRSLLNLVVSTFSILITANVALLGYAIANQRALLIGIGAIFPLAGLAVLYFVGRLIVPAIYTGLTIENQIQNRPDLFFWSLLAVMAGSSIPKLALIINIQDPKERLKSLRQFGGYMPFGHVTIWGLLILSGIQVIAAPILAIVFNWLWL
jgi:hypothetical protein